MSDINIPDTSCIDLFALPYSGDKVFDGLRYVQI